MNVFRANEVCVAQSEEWLDEKGNPFCGERGRAVRASTRKLSTKRKLNSSGFQSRFSDVEQNDKDTSTQNSTTSSSSTASPATTTTTTTNRDDSRLTKKSKPTITRKYQKNPVKGKKDRAEENDVDDEDEEEDDDDDEDDVTGSSQEDKVIAIPFEIWAPNSAGLWVRSAVMYKQASL